MPTLRLHGTSPDAYSPPSSVTTCSKLPHTVANFPTSECLGPAADGREEDRDRRALAGLGLDPNTPAMAAHDAEHRSHSHPTGDLGTEKGLEQPRPGARVHATTRVPNSEVDVGTFPQVRVPPDVFEKGSGCREGARLDPRPEYATSCCVRSTALRAAFSMSVR